MLKEIFTISDYPILLNADVQPFLEKLKTLAKTYLLIFLYVLAIAPLLVLAEYFVKHILHFAGIQNHNTNTFQHMFHKLGQLRSLFYVCLIGPILEECVFRLPLSFRRSHVAWGIAFAVYFFSGTIPGVKQFFHMLIPVYAIIIRLAFAALIGVASFTFLPADLQDRATHKKTWIILSIILFGLMHIANFIPLQWPLIWIYPVYVLPQLGMGWALAYMRFKNGFIWGIALHCMINSFSMLISSQYQSRNFKKAPLHVTPSPKSFDSKKIQAKELRYQLITRGFPGYHHQYHY